MDIQQLQSRLNEVIQANKIVGLVGPLGAGKTHLVKSFLCSLSKDFENQVNSPTYNLCNQYHSAGISICHFDLYRIENEEDLLDIGLWETIEDPCMISFIEWVDMFPTLYAQCDLIIRIEIDSEENRHYEMIFNSK